MSEQGPTNQQTGFTLQRRQLKNGSIFTEDHTKEKPVDSLLFRPKATPQMIKRLSLT